MGDSAGILSCHPAQAASSRGGNEEVIGLSPRDKHHRLPSSLSSFIGRDAEVAEVGILLRRHRLVTVTGPGGAGKSRLTQQLVSKFLGRHGDGAWWVELADLTDPELLSARVALSAGVHPELGASQRADLVSRLASHSGLLVLDNCEHLAPSVADLTAALLAAGRELRVLTTSRRPLGLDGEVVWCIPPLSLPPEGGHRTDTEDDLHQYASTHLFLERARAARPGFTVDGETASHIARLCQHLDGMPLALELAAARVRSLEVRRIREELDHAIDLLSAGRARRVPRHRTMRASIAWSEGLLTPEERVVFRRLAVFAAGFTLEDALPVVSGTDFADYRAVEALDGLVAQSLVTFDDACPGPARYRLLEVVRQHAAVRLRQAGEEANLRCRHAEQYAFRAGQLGSCLAHGWDDRAFAWLAGDVGNLEVALRFLCDRGALAQAAGLLWDTQGIWGLVRPAVAGRAVKCLLLHGDVLDAGVLARLHVAWSVVQADAGAMVAALETAERALPLAQEAKDWLAFARARVYRAAIRSAADPVRAEEELTLAVQGCVSAGDRAGSEFGRFWLGACVTVFQGATSRGMRLLAGQLDDTAASAHPVHTAGINALLAEALVERGELPAALEHAHATDEQVDRVAALLGSGAARFRAMSVPGSVAALVRGYAAILRDEQPLAGTDLVASSVRSAADGYAVAAYFYRFLSGLDRLRRDEGKHALDDFAAAEPLAAAAGGWFSANTRIVGAFAALSASDPDAATAWLAHVKADELSAPMLRARLRVVQANVALHRGDPDTAERLAHLELESAAAEELALETAQLLEVLARVAVAAQSPGEAVRLAGAATRLRLRKGLVTGPPAHLTPVQRDLATARVTLGARAFDEAWREGDRLPPQEAVAYVRRARGERRRPSFGWDSLTPTEWEVVELVASGLTNPQIGGRLLMSRETVKTHLRHVFAKLDVHSRAELAAGAERRAVVRGSRARARRRSD